MILRTGHPDQRGFCIDDDIDARLSRLSREVVVEDKYCRLAVCSVLADDIHNRLVALQFNALAVTVHESQRQLRAELRVAVARAITRTDLKAKATSDIQTLSRGYRQRVGVAQAILHEPDIVILDEPTNHLDLVAQIQILSLLRRLADHGKVVVSVLHDLNQLSKYCSRLALLRDGALVAKMAAWA